MTSQDKPSTLCLYPFVQMSTVPAGFFRPCCYFRGMLADGEGKLLSIQSHTLEDAWNSNFMKRVRKAMLAGESLKGCGQCYSEEATGNTSMRLRSFREWEDHPGVMRAVRMAPELSFGVDEPIRYLELKPGIVCNLKCRMCNQYDSVKIASELKELSEKLHAPHLRSRPRLLDDNEAAFDFNQMPDWSDHKPIWESISRAIPHLETVSIAGGEPTLLAEVHDFLRECVESGHSEHIKVYLSSNFTGLSEELLHLASRFKLFEFIASIDGIERIQEYIRFPSRWADVSANFNRVKDLVVDGRLKLLINLTLQMNNILHFTDVLDWLEAEGVEAFWQYPFALNLVYSPDYLSPFLLPPAGRMIALQRIADYRLRSKSLRKFPALGERFDLIEAKLNEPPPVEYRSQLLKFWRFTQVLDTHRKQNLAEVDPLLFGIVEEELTRLYGDALTTALGRPL